MTPRPTTMCRAAGTRPSRRSARELKRLDPKSVIFYASGRASLETSYLYALFARLYGHNNLPDSSNMCHETTSVALKKVIGAPVGTVRLRRSRRTATRCSSSARTPASNSPRFLHPLQDAAKRGVPIITFNPVREKGLEVFVNPQNPLADADRRRDTDQLAISSGAPRRRHRRPDRALQACLRSGRRRQGRREARARRRLHRPAHERLRGLRGQGRATDIVGGDRDASPASRARRSKRRRRSMSRPSASSASTAWASPSTCMASRTSPCSSTSCCSRAISAATAAGISPVRGHSNVQGQRTVGITEKPELVPLDKLAELSSTSSRRARRA